MVSYLALLPMGFSVPPRLLSERWALTPPFHPCRRHTIYSGGLFSVALSVEKPLDFPPASISNQTTGSSRWLFELRGIAPYGVRTFLPEPAPGAILRPSKIAMNHIGRVMELQVAGVGQFGWGAATDEPAPGLFRHGQVHVPGVIQNPAAVRASDDLLVRLTGYDRLPA